MNEGLQRILSLFQRRPEWPGEKNRLAYQRALVEFEIRPGDQVLDLGSGGDPFPQATILADHYVEVTRHRNVSLVTNGKPFLRANVEQLPFRDKSFEYVYCSHVLEHVEDPMKACAEIMRVGRRGFLETPNHAKDTLFAWAENMHKWHVVSIANTLVFFEYSQRQRQGIRSTAWRDIIFSRFYHPLQKAFFENQDVFNTMLSWDGDFKVVVFRLDGSMTTSGM
jgi:2-polyprenyl-3-methyl-5-hydroxy-6-metoxy-1,4-benzoquinol methylase